MGHVAMQLNRKPIRVGSVVAVSLGGTAAAATVIEDFGNLGVGGRQIVRIRIAMIDSPALEYEIPADELTVIETDDPRYTATG